MKKIYLSGIQEITKALKDGNVVFEEDTSNKIDKYRAIRLINGILVSSYVGKSHDSIFMNDYVCLNSGDTKFYIEEKGPIKLEVGKLYRTRNGKRVMCFYKYKTPYLYGYAIIKLDCFPQNAIYRVDENGLANTQTETIDDIVDYWED